MLRTESVIAIPSRMTPRIHHGTFQLNVDFRYG